MPLQSQLLGGDAKLDAAAVSDPGHIVPGASGPHVAKIQAALNRLDGANLAQDGIYGQGTASAVSSFKQKRQIFNAQGKIDNIVGKKTIAALDAEVLAIEKSGGGGVRGSGGPGNSNLFGDIPTVPPLQVVPFNPNAPEFILAQEFDSLNTEDLRFSDPPIPEQTFAEKAITTAMELGLRADLFSNLPGIVEKKKQFAMKAELGSSNGAVGLELAEFFFTNGVFPSNNFFAKQFGPGSSLSNRVRDSIEFQTEHQSSIHSDIDKALKLQFITGTIDFNLMRGVPQTNPKFQTPNFIGSPTGVKEPPRVGFRLGSSPTLLALIGDFQGCKLVLKSFDVNKSNNTYRATLRYEFIEHFGLDNSDVNPASSPGHGTPGQVCFWMLQHKGSRPGHIPFRYLVIVEMEITGSLDSSLPPPPGRGVFR